MAAKRRRRDELEAATAAVLLREQLHRLPQLPTLEQLLAGGKSRSARTDEEVARWQAAGFTVRRHNPKRYRIVRSFPRVS